jgi:hypothetical protein
MSNITPIRPGGNEPPTDPQAEYQEAPQDILSERLRHVRAIVDLIFLSDRESLDQDTISSALCVVDRYIIEAQQAVERLCVRPREAL